MRETTTTRPAFPRLFHPVVLALLLLGHLALTGCGATTDAAANSEPASAPARIQPEDATSSPATPDLASRTPASEPQPAGSEAAFATAFFTLDAGPPDFPPATCPVTRAPEPPFVPPAPYPEQPASGFFWYGTAALWTELPEDGRWHDLPYDAKTGYSQKIVFWNEHYDWKREPQPSLTLEGHRLDADAPPLDAAPATNAFHDDYGSFMMTGGGIPGAGCWQFTAHYNGDDLTYVVWVAP